MVLHFGVLGLLFSFGFVIQQMLPYSYYSGGFLDRHSYVLTPSSPWFRIRVVSKDMKRLQPKWSKVPRSSTINCHSCFLCLTNCFVFYVNGRYVRYIFWIGSVIKSFYFFFILFLYSNFLLYNFESLSFISNFFVPFLWGATLNSEPVRKNLLSLNHWVLMSRTEKSLG